MKSYTDIEQSKVLAKILSLESADMYYEEICNLPKAIIGNYILHNQCMEDKDYKKLSNPVLSPAWSFAALISVLPSTTLDKLNSSDNYYYRVLCMGRFTEWYDNPIDACYEMIIKLHELNLL